MKPQWIGLIAGMLIPLAGLAAEDPVEAIVAADAANPVEAVAGAICEREYQALPYGTILDLLDPEAPAERRASALETYERLATIKECPEFAYTLGQLYRHGHDLPGNPLAQDVPRARELIRPMAEEAGYIGAFADLAEMEMRHANAREAMLWTQVYLYLVQEVMLEGADAAERHYQRSAYNGNLLTRVELIWNWSKPSLPRKLKREDFHAYLATQPHLLQRVRANGKGSTHRRASAQNIGVTTTNDPGKCYVRDLDRLGAASAAWIVEVLPTGETGRIVLENFVPNASIAHEIRKCLQQYAFAPHGGTVPVTFRFSSVMGSREGASINRRRR
ncbi:MULTISPECIES: hypothetical protein [unclassified Luteimonas]